MKYLLRNKKVEYLGTKSNSLNMSKKNIKTIFGFVKIQQNLIVILALLSLLYRV